MTMFRRIPAPFNLGADPGRHPPPFPFPIHPLSQVTIITTIITATIITITTITTTIIMERPLRPQLGLIIIITVSSNYNVEI